jgi:diguanylate cyclase (GGDEF)-like protein
MVGQVNQAMKSVVLLALLLVAAAVHAAPVIDLVAGMPSSTLAPATRYAVDESGTADIATMFARVDAGEFAALPQGSPTFGFVDGAYWFHAPIHNRDHPEHRWLLVLEYALLDEVDVYLRASDGTTEHYESGDGRTFAHRSVSYRHPNFWIEIPPGAKIDLLVRVRSESSMQVPLKLYTSGAFLETARDAQLGIGIYYGILIALFLYNFILFLSLHDRSHFYYSAHVAGFGLVLFCLNGLAFEYLWPQSPWLANAAIPMSMALSMLFMQLFARDFLELPARFKIGDRIVMSLIAFHTAMLGLSAVLGYRTAVMIGTAAVFPGVLAIIVCAIVVARRGYRPALLFLLAWAMMLAGTTVYAMVSFGALPKTFVTEYGIQLGSAAEMIFLSFALAYRWASLRGENERIAREANEQLEHRVQVRTSELSAALDQLGEANARLREFSSRDGLTGVYNRRHFDQVFDPLLRGCEADGRACSLLVADLDHFKRVNDQHGHLAGDDCLRVVAQTLLACSAEGAVVARFGGEEFIVLLPGADELSARRAAETVRQRIASQTIATDGGAIVQLTISIGIATATIASGVDAAMLLRRADEALYEAKRAGRNRIVQQLVAA